MLMPSAVYSTPLHHDFTPAPAPALTALTAQSFPFQDVLPRSQSLNINHVSA